MKTPTPNPSEQRRSEELTQLIRQEIVQANGLISFARFMELALYTPSLGFYCSDTPKFGAAGDFVTAPEISSLFAKSVARQAEQVLTTLNGGDILEIGVGSGKFANDLLLELEKLNCLPQHYFIYEKSEALRAQQQITLRKDCSHLYSRIHWLDNLPLKNKLTGIIIANEVLDALPFHCFRIESDGIQERCVTFDRHGFCWEVAPPSKELIRRVNLILQECFLSPGYESEINLNLYQWLPQVANSLEKGVTLLFDYGYGRREYYHPDRTLGTFMCFYQHHRETNPFQWVGLQDITAHVDFTAVIECAIGETLRLGGYTTQSSFLLAAGLLDLASQNELTVIDQYQQNQAIKKLTLPSQMGELIKVMALTKNFQEPLLGFALHDRRRSL